jgi:hypothetical protein
MTFFLIKFLECFLTIFQRFSQRLVAHKKQGFCHRKPYLAEMSPMPEQQSSEIPYPNTLRQVRETKALISRAQLVARCASLAEKEPTRYVRIGTTALRDLELGISRPRRNTAATLGSALETMPEELFPGGFDDPTRNPEGNTRITERHLGGKPNEE